MALSAARLADFVADARRQRERARVTDAKTAGLISSAERAVAVAERLKRRLSR